MIKKLGKLITFALVVTAVAAGVYYFIKSREDDDMFEDSDNDIGDDLEEFLKNEEKKAEDIITPKREYVPLSFDSTENASTGTDPVDNTIPFTTEK
ncbi:MAG: hypothetical protein K6G84_05085 [Lachnospiraceae bacterium]|nr:hypothetical protein [Lachnospiraceae bacterium]